MRPRDLEHWVWISAAGVWIFSFAFPPLLILFAVLTGTYIYLVLVGRKQLERRRILRQYTRMIRGRVKQHCTSTLPPAPPKPSKVDAKEVAPTKGAQGAYTLDQLREEYGDDVPLSLGKQDVGTIKDLIERR